MITVYGIEPIPAPRQVRSHAWSPTNPVLRYRAYRDWLRLKKATCPTPFHHLIFALSVPASWSAAKRAASEGMGHTSKPDRDNLEKAFLDSVLEEDCTIWDGHCTKLWARRGMIIVSNRPIDIDTPFNLEPCYIALERSKGLDFATLHPEVFARI